MRKIIEAVNKYNKLNSSLRKRINEKLTSRNFGTYFKSIPVTDICDILDVFGIVLLQEDGTEFSGFFTGNHGSATLEIGYRESEYEKDGIKFYEIIDNSYLILDWYKMDNGKYEINTYLS